MAKIFTIVAFLTLLIPPTPTFADFQSTNDAIGNATTNVDECFSCFSKDCSSPRLENGATLWALCKGTCQDSHDSGIDLNFCIGVDMFGNLVGKEKYALLPSLAFFCSLSPSFLLSFLSFFLCLCLVLLTKNMSYETVEHSLRTALSATSPRMILMSFAAGAETGHATSRIPASILVRSFLSLSFPFSSLAFNLVI